MAQWAVFWTGISANHKLWGPIREFGYFVHEAKELYISDVELALCEVQDKERLQKLTITGITPLCSSST